jgi:hypothetical protein
MPFFVILNFTFGHSLKRIWISSVNSIDIVFLFTVFLQLCFDGQNVLPKLLGEVIVYEISTILDILRVRALIVDFLHGFDFIDEVKAQVMQISMDNGLCFLEDTSRMAGSRSREWFVADRLGKM